MSKYHDWQLSCEETFSGVNECQTTATETIEHLDNVIDKLEKQLDQYRWRDVKEELPEDDDEILIWPHHKYAGSTAHFNPYGDNGDGIGKDEFYYSTDDQWGEDYYHEISITHWMPMPKFDVEKQLNLKAEER